MSESKISEPLEILVVDDEEHQRMILKEFLATLGFSASEAASGNDALALLKENPSRFEVIFTDLSMQGIDGLELIKRAKDAGVEAHFVIVTAHGTIEAAIKAVKAGAFDFLLKPLEFDQVSLRVKQLLNLHQLKTRASALERENRQLRPDSAVIGKSAAMTALFAEIDRTAKAATTVLLTGETGTGKEVLARYIYERGSRADGPFITVNCSAIPENLVESEFFGHEKGAFTGADKRSQGLFEQAHGGTLFLDEIGEMDIKLQPKILRAIESRVIRRVGGTTDIPVDIRLIAATNRDLKKMVEAGSFREDLYFRLNVAHISIPPLRARREDLVDLTVALVARYAKTMNIPAPKIDASYFEKLSEYDFPGNVRELANIIERSLIHCTDGKLAAHHLHLEARSSPHPSSPTTSSPVRLPSSGESLSDLIARHERDLIQEGLKANAGDIEKTAKMFAVSRSTLYSKITKHGLK